MIFVFDGVRMNTFPSRAGAAVRGGVARPRSAAPSLEHKAPQIGPLQAMQPDMLIAEALTFTTK
jgi:hypothetical protein